MKRASVAPPLRRRILERAAPLLFARGFSKLTMDELAAELGISKRTLYQHFASKQQLLSEVLAGMMRSTAAAAERLIKDPAADFWTKLTGLLALLTGRLSQLSPAFLGDLERNAPDLWREIDDFRRGKINDNFLRLYRSGVRQGMVRDDIDPRLLLLLYATLVQQLVNPRTAARLGRGPDEVLDAVARVFFAGVLTDRARAKYHHRMNIFNTETER
jgi:AcrR family transcriptional regulator